MNPIVQVGRYQIPIASVQIIQKREGFWAHFCTYWFGALGYEAGYNVYLAGGIKLRLTEEEKEQLDHELETQQAVAQVYGMFRSWQENNRPR